MSYFKRLVVRESVEGVSADQFMVQWPEAKVEVILTQQDYHQDL
jgi:hypothetical protein